ncbi:hypothetical protein V8C34DRAFT_259976 [Trichoderma compactum]
MTSFMSFRTVWCVVLERGLQDGWLKPHPLKRYPKNKGLFLRECLLRNGRLSVGFCNKIINCFIYRHIYTCTLYLPDIG